MRTVVIAGALAIAGASEIKGYAAQHDAGTSLESRLVVLPDPSTVELWSLGYREALADLVFIRGNLATSALKHRDEHRWISRYFDVLHRLDPRFRAIYQWAAVASIYSGLKRIEKDFVATSRRVYDLALEEYPHDHELLWSGGMVEFSEVSEEAGFAEDEVKFARAKGTERIREAAANGASPLVRRLAISLGRNDENIDLNLERAYLRSQVLTSDDPALLQYAKTRLRELSSAVEAERIDQLRDGFLERRKRDFPYVPPPVFLLLDVEQTPPPSPAPIDSP